MDKLIAQLAEALGLAKDAKPEDVFAKAAEQLSTAKKSEEAAKKLTEQLSAHGLKLEDGKIVKAEAASSTSDDPEKAKMRKEIEELQLSSIKKDLASASTEAENLVKSGKVPPAMLNTVKKLLSIGQGAQALSLSADGTQSIKSAVNVAEELKALFAVLPSALSTALRQGASETEKSKAEELATKGREVAKKVMAAAGKK